MYANALELYLKRLNEPACIIDPSGCVCAANGPWTSGLGHGGGMLSLVPIGDDYLQFCEAVAAHGFPAARQLARRIEDTLKGRRSRFALRYQHRAASHLEGFSVRIIRLDIHHRRHVLLIHRRRPAIIH